jgi:hypothetical protein
MADRSVARLDLLSDHFLREDAESFHMVQVSFLDKRIEFWTTKLNFGQPKRCCDLRVKIPLGRQIAPDV